MKKLQLEITIQASRTTVWDSVVNDHKYRFWASAFQEGSYFEGGWNKGDSILFVGLNEEGKKEGMVSEIAESNFPEYISIRHLGYIVNGVPDTTSDAIKAWAPSYENYTLKEVDPKTTVFLLEMDTNDEYYEMFLKLWPAALLKLKEVSEQAR